MATFLLTWELGGGLGHLVPLRALAIGLRQRGHRAVVAVNDLPGASALMSEIPCIPAPVHVPLRSRMIAEPSTFADLLYNAGCADESILQGLAFGWRSLFEVIDPDVVVMDFSPAALVALQGCRPRRVLLGCGHSCPPDVSPLPDLCPWRDNYPDRLRQTESQVLEALNRQLARQFAPPLARVAELFQRVDLNLLTTFAELDHYQVRGAADYWGVLADLPGEHPTWPDGSWPRVFVYLKPRGEVGPLLAELGRRNLSTIAYVPKAAGARQAALPSCLHITDQPLDLEQILATCDVAILNAGHNTTARALLAGKPILALPISGEQQVVANNAARLGAAVSVTGRPDECIAGLEKLLADERFAQAARVFAAKYATFDSRRLLSSILDHLESLAS
ncbi:MAG: glycosyltransferase [Pirellulales bacterium]